MQDFENLIANLLVGQQKLLLNNKKLENINKNFFILNSYIKPFYKNYTLVFATIYQLIA